MDHSIIVNCDGELPLIIRTIDDLQYWNAITDHSTSRPTEITSCQTWVNIWCSVGECIVTATLLSLLLLLYVAFDENCRKSMAEIRVCVLTMYYFRSTMFVFVLFYKSRSRWQIDQACSTSYQGISNSLTNWTKRFKVYKKWQIMRIDTKITQ